MHKAVFICHASREASLARGICAELEARGISCWIAPRDVPLGLGYGRAIVDAIAGCELVVFVFSPSSNASHQVLREIERAVHHQRDLLPFRIAPIEPSKDLEYFISAYQWFDAFPGPPETHLTRFGDAALHLLQSRREIVADTPSGVLPPAPSWENVLHSPEDAHQPRAERRQRRWRPFALAVGAVIFLMGAVTVLLKWYGPMHPAESPGILLKAPADGANLARPSLLLEWEPAASLDPQGLSFELRAWTDHAPPLTTRLTRDSYVLDDMEGLIHWQVRPVWQSPQRPEAVGIWSPARSCTYYRDALSRLLHTHSLHVGIAEADGIFVADEATGITGAEIELLHAVASRIIQASSPGHGGEVTLFYHPAVWGDKFFHLLGDESIDVLASGISISAEREKLYGLIFTQETFRYPQTLIIHTGTATTDANGKLALQALGVVDHTTNLTLGRALAGPDGEARLRLYEGSGAYFRMINDLAAGMLDGVLMDQPYALKQLAEFKRRQPSNDLTTEDVTARLASNYPAERIGFAVRRADTALQGALNRQLDALGPLKAELIQRYISRPLPSPPVLPSPP